MQTVLEQKEQEITDLKRKIGDLEATISEARARIQMALDSARQFAAQAETAQRVLAGVKRTND